MSCQHYEINRRCAAFEVIPDEIWDGRNPHLEPLKGQGNKTVFKPFDFD